MEDPKIRERKLEKRKWRIEEKKKEALEESFIKVKASAIFCTSIIEIEGEYFPMPKNFYSDYITFFYFLYLILEFYLS